MNLESAKELKRQLQFEMLDAQRTVTFGRRPVAYSVDRDRGMVNAVAALAGGLNLSEFRIHGSLPLLTPALGVSRRGEKDFGLAVRVQEPTRASGQLIDLLVSRSNEEIDVRTVGRVIALTVDPCAENRPLCEGLSISHPNTSAGTLCCFVERNGMTPELLSANHVIANANAGRLGDPVLQPGAFDGGVVPDHQIGELTEIVPLVAGQVNTVDAALGSRGLDQLRAELTELRAGGGRSVANRGGSQVWADV